MENEGSCPSEALRIKVVSSHGGDRAYPPSGETLVILENGHWNCLMNAPQDQQNPGRKEVNAKSNAPARFFRVTLLVI